MHQICDWIKHHNRHTSKSKWVTRLLFCQNDSPIRGSFRPKDILITHILFELCLYTRYLAQSTFFRTPSTLVLNGWQTCKFYYFETYFCDFDELIKPTKVKNISFLLYIIWDFLANPNPLSHLNWRFRCLCWSLNKSWQNELRSDLMII